MKILIDISQIVYGTGVSIYTKNLIEALLKIDGDNEYSFFAGSLRRQKEIRTYLEGLSGYSFQKKILPFPPVLADILWNKLHVVGIENFTGKVDVFHSSDWAQPPSNAFKVTTVHDLVPIKFPKLSHAKLISAHVLRLKWVVKEVDRVIVPSRSSADDLEKLGVEGSRIRVIPEAPDPGFGPASIEDIDNLKRKYRISGKYLLSIGITPRKNIERIIKSYEKIKGEKNLKLVVVGHPYTKVQIPRGVIFVGHVPFSELPAFYTGSEVLVYPSLYEGFGLPILEGMACGIPVVTSNLGSMLEVGDKAAIFVDPYDEDSISE
jgi:glycosyltransferase involved in cell wall biosynthesis